MDITSKGFKKPLATEGYDINIVNANMQLANDLIEDIEDGTAAVGNASKLGGQSPTYYATTEQINSLDALVGLGGVKESGSNANGSYVKFEDGTMICKNIVDVADKAITTVTGALFRNASASYYFPATFYDIPSAFVTFSGTSLVFFGSNIIDTTRIAGYAQSSGSQTPVTLKAHIFAIGRWKA